MAAQKIDHIIGLRKSKNASDAVGSFFCLFAFRHTFLCHYILFNLPLGKKLMKKKKKKKFPWPWPRTQRKQSKGEGTGLSKPSPFHYLYSCYVLDTGQPPTPQLLSPTLSACWVCLKSCKMSIVSFLLS